LEPKNPKPNTTHKKNSSFSPTATHTDTMLASRGALQALQRRAIAPTTIRGLATSLEQYENFGKHVFAGAVAKEYLEKHGLDASVIKNPTWVKTNADTVANAIFDW
jgi:hypothetical protein